MRWLVVAIPLAIAVACSDYEDEPSVGGTDAGVEDAPLAPPVDANGRPVDAAPSTAAIAPACPPAAYAATCLPGECELRTLSTPNVPEVVFAVRTDADAVYWLAQPSDPENKGYNGQGIARVMRVRKSGGAPADVLVEGQPLTTRLVLDGEWIYWTTPFAGDRVDIRRTRRDCTAPCSFEVLATATGTAPTDGLLRLRAGLLALQSTNGFVRTFDVDAKRFDESLSSGDFPALTATLDRIFVGSGTTTHVSSTPIAGGVTTKWTLPPVEDTAASSPGVVRLATDCTSLFAIRNDRAIWRAPIETGAFTTFTASVDATYDVAVDARYFYTAAANAGGVFATDLATGSRITITQGNIWSVTVDDQGVYWGTHEQANGGAIRMMLK